MPVHQGEDRKGNFYQWGKDQPGHKKWTKYYYKANNTQSENLAKRKALKQGMAVMISRQRLY